jgi:hypothetical protein
MEALKLDKLVKSKFGKRLALSRVLPSYPSEVLEAELLHAREPSFEITHWCRVIASIDKDGASLDIFNELMTLVGILGPDAGC